MSTATLVKKDLILGGLTCAHCAEEISTVVKKIKGIEDSNLNFVNKKLTLQLDSSYNEKEIIKEVITKIDSIEPGLDIQVIEKKSRQISPNKVKEINKKELILLKLFKLISLIKIDTTILAATTQTAYVKKNHTLIWVYMSNNIIFILYGNDTIFSIKNQ